VSPLFIRHRSAEFYRDGGKLTRRCDYPLGWPVRHRSFTTISFREWQKRTMAALDHSRRFGHRSAISALLLTADMLTSAGFRQQGPRVAFVLPNQSGWAVPSLITGLVPA
jgi:hypothetical protein